MHWLCFCLLLLAALSGVNSAAGQETPTVLTCVSSVKAERDYEFTSQKWSGERGRILDHEGLFEISMRNAEKKEQIVQPLRDKVFSGLNTRRPIVRSISRYIDGVEQGVEFEATVMSRAFDTVFLAWSNDPPHNKMWLAAVNLKHRKAIVTHIFEGMTSVGGELETLDCR